MSEESSSVVTPTWWRLTGRTRTAVYAVLTTVAYLLYITGLTTNPPGFFIDESANSYNAYTLYQSWQGEVGDFMPLFFPVFPLAPPLDYLNFVDPVQVYCLAALFYIFPPSFFLPRALSATVVFLAVIVIGLLAKRVSGRTSVGVIVGLMALGTPWLYELGRMAFGAAFYPLSVALLLFGIYRAYSKRRWAMTDIVFIALSLGLCTYSYAIGRLLGPLLALGMVLLITDRQRLRGVLLSWFGYAVTLVPMLIFHLRHPHALKGRYDMTVGYIKPDTPFLEIISGFLSHYFENVSIYRLLLIGDQNLRHHIANTGPILFGTLVLTFLGVFLIIIKHYREAWWRYVVYGSLVSAIPASLTVDAFHMLRLAALPVFLLVLAVPAVGWLAGDGKAAAGTDTHTKVRRGWRTAALLAVILITFAQAVYFQVQYWVYTPERRDYYDVKFPAALAAALNQPQRPIYLVDQYYYHTYWYSTVQGIDLSNFVYLRPYNRPPINSVVLSGEERCTDCDEIYKDVPYIVYKTRTGDPAPIKDVERSDDAQMLHPRGVAVDAAGNYFVADTENARIVKFGPDRSFISEFGQQGNGEGELRAPNGIVIDADGYMYVTDALNDKLVKFDEEGKFVREWRGPDGGFYGPRDVALGTRNDLYIVDQGKTRIVKFDIGTDSFSSWGTRGSGDGQLNEPTGLAIGDGRVYVTDTGNERVQVFDLSGKYLSQWSVPQWQSYSFRYPDIVYDETANRLYVTSSGTGEILTYDLSGKLLETIKPANERQLVNPSALVISTAGGKRRLFVLSTESSNISIFDLGDTGISK